MDMHPQWRVAARSVVWGRSRGPGASGRGVTGGPGVRPGTGRSRETNGNTKEPLAKVRRQWRLASSSLRPEDRACRGDCGRLPGRGDGTRPDCAAGPDSGNRTGHRTSIDPLPGTHRECVPYTADTTTVHCHTLPYTAIHCRHYYSTTAPTLYTTATAPTAEPTPVSPPTVQHGASQAPVRHPNRTSGYLSDSTTRPLRTERAIDLSTTGRGKSQHYRFRKQNRPTVAPINKMFTYNPDNVDVALWSVIAAIMLGTS